ncbi:MAG: hypothetical protein BWY37_01056 [Firmicutes bacterium ADurb.Bin262]|nr:MAG: hypothetical protein BWY37_01056 [Firmicutes bacterium ADurb.Bin262]
MEIHDALIGHGSRTAVRVEYDVVYICGPDRVQRDGSPRCRCQVHNALLVDIRRRRRSCGGAPPQEGVAASGKAVVVERSCHVIGMGRTDGRAARRAVSVVCHGIGDRYPFGIKRHTNGAHGVIAAVRVFGGSAGGGRPAPEGISDSRETVDGQSGRRARSDGLGRHRPGRRAVAVKGHRVLIKGEILNRQLQLLRAVIDIRLVNDIVVV